MILQVLLVTALGAVLGWLALPPRPGDTREEHGEADAGAGAPTTVRRWADEEAKWAAFLSWAADEANDDRLRVAARTVAGLVPGERAWVRRESIRRGRGGRLWLRADAPVTRRPRGHLVEIRRTPGGYHVAEHHPADGVPARDDEIQVTGTFSA